MATAGEKLTRHSTPTPPPLYTPTYTRYRRIASDVREKSISWSANCRLALFIFFFHLGTAWSGGAARTCDAAGADRVMVSTDRNMHVAVSVGDRRQVLRF